MECDGATYHRSATARDRDRLREHILSNLGWRIRRVWSTEWWMDAERAFEALHAKLVADLENDRSAPKAEEPILASQSSSEGDAAPAPDVESIDAEPASRDSGLDAAPPVADQAKPPTPDQDNEAPEEQRIYARRAAEPSDDSVIPAPEGIYVPAKVADSGHTPDGDRFYDAAYRPGLREMVRHVIRTEGPIFDDVLVQRLARAHGFQRAAGKIREIVLGVVPQSIERTNEDGRIVFWPEDADPGRPFPLRKSEPDVRTHGDIPIHELASLAASLASDEDDEEVVIRLMAEKFGLSRIKQGTRARFEAALRLAKGSA